MYNSLAQRLAVYTASPADLPLSAQQTLLQQVIRSQAVRVVLHTAETRALNPEPSSLGIADKLTSA